MLTKFRYKGFDPTPNLTQDTYSILDHLQNISPSDATLVGLTEFDGVSYGCSFDLFLNRGSVYVFTTGSDPEQALEQASHELESKINAIQSPSEAMPVYAPGLRRARRRESQHLFQD